MAEGQEDRVCVKRYTLIVEIPNTESVDGPELGAKELEERIEHVQGEMHELNFPELFKTVASQIATEHLLEFRPVVVIEGGD